MRPNRVADARTGLTCRSSAERDHSTGRIGTAEGIERTSARRRIVDDHRGERLAERRLDRLLPPGVDLDEVEQRAEHPVDTGQTLGTGAGSGGVEREFESFDPSGAARFLLGSVIAQRLTRLVGRHGLDERRFGQLDVGDERFLDRSRLVALGPEPDGTFRTGVTTCRE